MNTPTVSPAGTVAAQADLQRRAAVIGMLAVAARGISPHYPLETFIARNPVADHEEQPFDQAVRSVAAEHGAALTLPEPAFRSLFHDGVIEESALHAAIRFHITDARTPDPIRFRGGSWTVRDLLTVDLLHAPPAPAPQRVLHTPAELLAPRVHARIDEQVTRWVTTALGAPTWTAHADGEGLWERWRRLAAMDPHLPRRVRAGIRTSPPHPADAIAQALHRWGWDGQVAERFLRAHILAQPGLSATVRHATASGDQTVTLTGLVAIRTTLESLLLPAGTVTAPTLGYTAPTPAPFAPTPDRVAAIAAATRIDITVPDDRDRLVRILSLVDESSRLLIWQEAYERTLARDITPAVEPVIRAGSHPPPRFLAQAVFCIDPRSEGLRRHLEQSGEVDTFGFAGFFGVPISYRDAAGGPPVASCPVLLTPRREIAESSFDLPALHRWQTRLDTGHTARATEKAVKESPVAPFAYAETAGWLIGPSMIARTLAPTWWARIAGAFIRPRKPATRLDADVVMDRDERVLYAETALRMMGLVDAFARIILLCGHGATVTNNPYTAAYQCGACGGNEGAPNARAAAMIFNDPTTRSRLKGRGIRIPEDTLFVAAQHDTVTDQVSILEPWVIPATHHDDVTRLVQLLATAGQNNTAERLTTLPGGPRRTGAGRSADWAEVYPEWGLVGNTAFIIGPRRLTRHRNLHRRVFLHNYDPDADPDGTALETILTAPMIVAHWINAQYRSSTVAPDRFGAGPKPLHNVVGTIGVLSGYSGDLRLGLPWQSVGVGQQPRHTPTRLQVYVQAPLERINTIIDTADVVRTLIDNEWVILRARDTDTDPWLRYGGYAWEPDTPTSTHTEPTPNESTRRTQ